MPQQLAESDKGRSTWDTAVDFGSPYRYFVQAYGGDLRQSEVSVTVGVTPADTFPPAVPVGVMAVAASTRLSWHGSPNYRRNLAGYQVYARRRAARGENRGTGECARISAIARWRLAKKYSYTITAIRSPETKSAHSTGRRGARRN